MSAPVEVKTTCRRSFQMGHWRVTEQGTDVWHVGHVNAGGNSRMWVHGTISAHRERLIELLDVIDTILALP